MLNTVHNLLPFFLLLGGVLGDTASGVWFNTNTSKLCPDDSCTSVNISSAAYLHCCNAPAAASCDSYTCPVQTHYKKSDTNHSCVGTVCQVDSTVDLDQCCKAYTTCGDSPAVNQTTCDDSFDHENISTFVSDAICPKSGCSNKICCFNNHTINTTMDTCHDVCHDEGKQLISPVPECSGTSCNSTTCCVDSVQCSDQIRCEVDETLEGSNNCTDYICTHDECCSKTPVLCYKARETNVSHVCDTTNHVKNTTAIYIYHTTDSFDAQCCENITASSKTACGLSSNQTCADPSTQMYSSHFSYNNNTGFDAAPGSCCVPKPTCKDDFNQNYCLWTAPPTPEPTTPPATPSPTPPPPPPPPPTPSPTTPPPTLEVFNNHYQPEYPATKVKRDWVDSSFIDRIFTIKIYGEFETLYTRIDKALATRRRLTETRASVMIAIAEAIHKKAEDYIISVKIDKVDTEHIQFEVFANDGVELNRLETAYKIGTMLKLAGIDYAVTSVKVTRNEDLYQHHLDFSWQLLVPYTGEHEDCTGVVGNLSKKVVIEAIEDTFKTYRLILRDVDITHLSCTDTSHVHCACEAAYTDNDDGFKKCKEADKYASIHYTAKTSIHSQHEKLKDALNSVHTNKDTIHDKVIDKLKLHTGVFTADNIDNMIVAEVDESCFKKGFSPGEIFGIVLGALILSALLGYGIYYLVLSLQGRSPYVPLMGAASVSSSSMVYGL